ncbi:MAG: YaeQ family protein [Candidatus Omnitrophica bacterium]|nr:YaeQ family protein [Candidatus Omnitrophota bacterium]
MIEKYTFQLCSERIQQKKKMVFVKSSSETQGHVILKLLGYMLFYHPDLRVEAKVGMHYKPDLALDGDGGVPSLWIDCGYIALKKAEKLAHQLKRTRFVIIKKTNREIENFKKLVDKRFEDSTVEYLAFEPAFVDRLAGALRRINEVTIYPVMDNAIGVVFNEELFESQVFRL